MKKSTGTVSITAEHDGRHEYCFSNQMSTVVDKIVRCVKFGPDQRRRGELTDSYFVSFNVHGVIYVDGDGKSYAIVIREVVLIWNRHRCTY